MSNGKFSSKEILISPKMPPMEYKKVQNVLRKLGAICTQKSTNDCIFVLPSFTGKEYQEEFDMLRKQGRIILGVPFIYDCARTKKTIPENLDASTAIFSTVMTSISVCCTGIDREERDHLTDLMSLMSGSCHRDLTNAVTHVVATSTNTEKYHAAVKFGIPVVQPKWIQDCWEQNTLLNYQDYLLYPFSNLVISVSSLDNATRSDIERKIRSFGGSFERDLKKNLTTHLVATKPKGKKYLGALKWGVLVVTPQWVDDCITHKVRLSEDLYPVASEDSATKSKLTSMIDSQEASKVTETEGIIHSAANSNNSFDSQSETSNSHNSAKLRASSSTAKPPEDEDSQYNTLYLSGCKIFLKGFNQETEHLLMKLISTGSGVRLKNFDRSVVTHYIVDLPSISTLQPLVETGCLNLSPSLLHQLRSTHTININTLSLLSQLKIVKSDWLEACWKAKKMVDTAKSEVFISVDLLATIIEQTNATQPKDDLSPPPPIQPTIDAPIDTNPTDTRPTELEPDNNEDANQLSPCKVSSTLENIAIGTMNWTADENSKIREIISSNGGIFFEINTKNPEIPSYVNYILVPHGDHDSIQKLQQASKLGKVQKLPAIVSYQWLKRSTEAHTLLPVPSFVAFTPLPQPIPYPSFQKHKIAISGFQDLEERKNIATLIQMLGAEFSLALNKLCTHLICQEAAGPKFEAARKWGVEKINIVTLDWLTASAKNGEALPETSYLLSDTGNTLRPPSLSRANSQEDTLDEDVSVAATQIPARTVSALNLTGHLQPVLAGVTVCISKRISMEKQNRYEQIVSMLGGSYCYVVDKTVTHYVSETKSELTGSELKGRSKDIKMVSPLWLEKCLEMKAKLDEAEFPCTINPKMSLGIVGLSLSQPTIPPLPPTTLTSVVPKRSVREIQLVSPEPRAAKKPRTSKKQKEASSETWDMTVKRLNMQAQKRLSVGGVVSSSTTKSTLGMSPQQQVMAKHNATSLDDLPLAERLTIKNQIKQATSPVKLPKVPLNNFTTTLNNNNTTANKEELFVASTPMTQMERQEPARAAPPPRKQKSDPEIKPAESPAKIVHTHDVASMDVAVDESGRAPPSLLPNPSLLSADESRTSISDASNDSAHLDDMETEDIHEHNEQSKLVEEKVRNFFSLMANNPIVAQVQKAWTPIIAKPKAPVAPRGITRLVDREDEPTIGSEDNSEMDDVHIPNSQVVVYMNHAEIDGRKKLKERASGGFPSELVNVQQQVQTVTKTLNNNSVHVVATQTTVQTLVQTSMPPPASISSRRGKKPNQIIEECRVTEVPEDDEDMQEAPKNPQYTRTHPYSFLISNAQNGAAKSELVKIIRTLGGHVADDEQFGSNFTHLITPAVTASQKCLAACAKGLILLKPSYLEQSSDIGRFLNEKEQEPHQWKVEDADTESLRSVIGGAYKCKQKLESLGRRGNGGMFTGMTVVLFMQQGQEQQWENILVAGGAQVLAKGTAENILEATHVFFEPKKYKEIMHDPSKFDFEMGLINKLRRAKVPLLEVGYLRNLLYTGGQVQEDTYNVEKAK